MKYTLEELLDSLEPCELDELLPNHLDPKLPKSALARIEKKALEKTGLQKQKKRRFHYRVWASIAVCLILTVSFAAVAEAKEYSAAMSFFTENGLSAEGLSREDVKAVYRDITTQRFANQKTAEVIRHSVPGTEIPQKEPTPEELAALWNSNAKNAAASIETNYTVHTKYRLDETLGFDVFEKSDVDCRSNGETIWSAEISSFLVSDCALTPNGTAAWGYTYIWSSEQPSPAWLAQLDDDGNMLWEQQLDHGFRHEFIADVLDNGDGTWAVISRGNLEYLCLSRFDQNGNELSFRKTQVGNKGIWNAARLGEGYLVLLGNTAAGDTAHLVKLDRDGTATDHFIYESEECDYYITDMAEFEGRIYLSAYAVPHRDENGGTYEIGGILDYIFEKDDWQISDEELTPLVRDNYTAVLLLCDPSSGSAQTFYSVKGALGGSVHEENGRLQWNVNSVVSTAFSPYTSAYSISGICKVYRYSFGSSGVLIGYEDTGETAPYWK